MGHEPVLVDRVVELLVPALEDGGIIVDATLGRGGHAARLLAAAPRSRLIGIDRDPIALAASHSALDEFSRRTTFVREDFTRLEAVLERLGIEAIRGVLFDLGVSSPQLDEAARGFSFRHEGPLDMRMDPGSDLTADEVVNTYDERALARVIRIYGEERFATRIARAIVRSRPVRTTAQLADVVRTAIPAATRRTGGHPARRTFQALRIEVNAELEALDRALPVAIDALDPGGRIAVISYHSLEDRRVKKEFQERARGCVCPPDLPICVCGRGADLRILTRRPLRPSDDEIEANPRARAAKLRAAERLGVASRDETGKTDLTRRKSA